MSQNTVKPDLPFWGLALGAALCLLSGTLVATGSRVQAEAVEVPAGSRLSGPDMSIGPSDLICLHRPTGATIHIDDLGMAR